ncbi:MAG: hypothetical protein ACFFBD_13270 [Candidatus Hodarchaeota archaeon]
MKSHRSSSHLIDVITWADLPTDSDKIAEILQLYADADAIWWNTGVNLFDGSFEKAREQIQKDPPDVYCA